MKFKIKGIPVKYFFMPSKWAAWIRGMMFKKYIGEAYLKQFMYRYTHPSCQPCVEKGKCIECGCDTIAKMMDPKSDCIDEETGRYNWGSMMSAQGWKDFESTYGIKFSQTKTKLSDGE